MLGLLVRKLRALRSTCAVSFCSHVMVGLLREAQSWAGFIVVAVVCKESDAGTNARQEQY